ncbi:MAG: hypothetical protein Q8P76_00280 [bacterium]|nr:hypothetical protein [bacterium]
MRFKKSSKNKKIVVTVSGGFDPLHVGHGGKVQSSSWLLTAYTSKLNNARNRINNKK